MALAERNDVPLAFVDTSVDNDELVRRLQDRSSASDDVSEANTRVLQYQRANGRSLSPRMSVSMRAQ